MAIQHSLFSQNQDLTVKWFTKFDKEAIKKAIMEHLTAYPTDTLEHCKEFNASDLRRFAGNEIISFYAVDKVSKKVCKVVMRGSKEVYYTLK